MAHVKNQSGPNQHIAYIIDPLVDFTRTFAIQSGAAVKRSSITWYWRNHCSYWGRIQIRVWAHKTHHIARPNGRAMWCLLWGLSTRIDRVITALHYPVGNASEKISRYRTIIDTIQSFKICLLIWKTFAARVFVHSKSAHSNGQQIFQCKDSVQIYYHRHVRTF